MIIKIVLCGVPKPSIHVDLFRLLMKSLNLRSLTIVNLNDVYAETDRKGDRTGKEGLMASNYVDAMEEEGRFHGHYSSSTTPTGAAASPKTKRRGWPGSASAPSGAGGHGPAPKCVCAPPTHAGSFKCRLHRTSSHGGGHGSHPSSSPPSPANAAPPHPAAPSSSSRTVAAQ